MARIAPYDTTRESLYKPGLSDDFFEGWGAQSDAALCAEMSRLAYCRDTPTIERSLARIGFELASDPFDRESTFAFFAKGESSSVLAFRGTETDDPTDAIDDALIVPQPWRDMGLAHLGFSQALDRIWDDVGSAIEHVAGTLFITGLSLGAALATLASARRPPTRMFTFGSPRVGDVEFALAFEARVKGSRYVNCCDLVTRVPPPPYKHAGKMLYIDRKGTVSESPEGLEIERDRLRASAEYLEEYSWRFGNVLVRDLADHAPINYVAALKTL